ncbi:hypothetical protein DUNSADRAFT_2728 [Dunaliella salina]|uniref:Plectin n=1 Tax=Dunaliella salina TaxID=3046 RepID=A0ABQ7GV81_DUNSA|nr:hypothetical protein DUNSADRAFT_2728 [Dunaliella salina]|eukprot:KAF5838530.1 hypothetical protein DUNSADRAFT_2728 [Dunaliella salina]
MERQAGFKQQLEEVLTDVAETEANLEELQHKHEEGCKRLEEQSKRAAQLSADNKLLGRQLEQARTQNADMFNALQAAEGSVRELKAGSATAASILAEERRQRREEVAAAAQRAELLQQQQREALEQCQHMMQRVAEKDEQIAAIAADAARASASLKAGQEELARMEAVARATGERAAAAEALLGGRAESIGVLHAELSRLREKWPARRPSRLHSRNLGMSSGMPLPQ